MHTGVHNLAMEILTLRACGAVDYQRRGYTCNALLQCKFVKQSNIYIVLQILFLLHRLGDVVLAAFMLFSCS